VLLCDGIFIAQHEARYYVCMTSRRGHLGATSLVKYCSTHIDWHIGAWKKGSS
jgi:hypothetical protein